MCLFSPAPASRYISRSYQPVLHPPPTLYRHDVYDCKCDVWSWGVLFAECLDGGRLPYWHTYMTPVQVRGVDLYI